LRQGDKKPCGWSERVPGVTLGAGLVTAVPPLFGVSVTVTPAGKIAPLGNPEPVTVTVVTPATPVVGLVELPRATLASFTVKALASDTVSLPVTTVTLRLPTAAVLLITMLAVALVELVTVTGPVAPATAPPTAMSAPKFACVT